MPDHSQLKSVSCLQTVSAARVGDAFDLEFRIVTKVHEQTELKSGCLQIILYLSAVLLSQFPHGLEFENDFVIADEVRFVRALQWCAFVFKGKRLLGHKWDSLQPLLDNHAL